MIVSSVYYKNLYWVYKIQPNALIYALNESIVIYRKIILIIDTIFIIINIFSIIKFQGLVARQPYLCKNIPYLVCYLDIHVYGC